MIVNRQRAQALGQPVELPPQQRQGFSDLSAHGLVQGTLVELGKRFRLEFRQALFRCQAHVHFSGAPAQQAGGFQIISDEPGCLVGRGRVQQVDGESGRQVQKGLPHGSLEVMAQAVQGVTPGIALVGHKPLQDGDGHRFILVQPKLDRAGGRCAVRKSFFGEQPPDFKVRIDPRGELADELENQPVAEPDRCVALLCPHHRRRRQGLAFREQRAEGARGGTPHLPVASVDDSFAGQNLQQRFAEGGIGQRIVQQKGRVACP